MERLLHKGIVALDTDAIRNSLEHSRNVLAKLENAEKIKLRLTKPFRKQHFPLLHLLLCNTSPAVISRSVPRPASMLASCGKGDFGLLLLFDDEVASYAQDGIEWDAKRVCMKHIIQTHSRSGKLIMKLKNSKTDKGVPCMRRQTYVSTDGLWRKHEYKLLTLDTLFKQAADGTISSTQQPTLNQHPTLVHYFVKPEGLHGGVGAGAASAVKGVKNSRARSGVVAKSADGGLSKKRRLEERTEEDGEDEEDEEESRFSSSMVENENTAPRSIITGSAGTQRRTVPPRAAKQVMYNNASGSPGAALEFDALAYGGGGGVKGVGGQLHGSKDLLLSTSIMGSPLRLDSNGLFSEGADMQAIDWMLDSTPYAPSIITYAPDCGPCVEYTKVLAQIGGFEEVKGSERNVDISYNCIFDQQAVLGKCIAQGVLETHAPPHEAGVVSFHVERTVRNMASGEVVKCEASEKGRFYYLPISGQLRLQFKQMTEGEISEVMARFRHSVRDLDISGNVLRHINFLAGYNQLQTLILSENMLTGSGHPHHFPLLPKLHTLNVDDNALDNAEHFMDMVTLSFPNLKILSTLNNPMNPKDGSLPHHYYNYRLFILSKARGLTQLDGQKVSVEEWKHAASIMHGGEG